MLLKGSSSKVHTTQTGPNHSSYIEITRLPIQPQHSTFLSPYSLLFISQFTKSHTDKEEELLITYNMNM